MINTRVGSPALCAFRKVPKGDLLGSQHPAQKMTKEGSQNGTSDKAGAGVIPRSEDSLHAMNVLVRVEEKRE
jgi:hypothetical protein